MQDESSRDASTHFYKDSMDLVPGMELGNFLSRPVNIKTIEWDQTGPFSGTVIDTFDPWTLFLSNAKIKKKLDNFAFIRGNLHVKFILASTPFVYGAALAAYLPLPNFKKSIINEDSSACVLTASQRPSVWLYPATNTGGELVCPFFWPRTFVALNSASDVSVMGRISLYQAFLPYHATNYTLPEPVTIQVYAWMTDVELHGPTMGLALQSKTTDEYDGVISGPASAVANVAGKLTDVPVIGQFATAAQIGASALAKASSLFGYTNTPIIDDTKPLMPTPFPQFASPEISHPISKLTLDPKNELSVDHTLHGLPREDELAVAKILQRESVIDYFQVTGSDTVDSLQWTTRVNPNQYTINDVTPVANAVHVIPTPQAWLAQAFDYWRGDIIYRFRVICTQYHRGKLRISWDPTGVNALNQNIIVDPDSSNAVLTQIVDIEPNKDIEFRVPYTQVYKWLTMDPDCSAAKQNCGYFADGPMPGSLNTVPGYDNGCLTVRLFNRLTGPAATAANNTIFVIVSMRGAENLEYASPRQLGHFDNNQKMLTYFKAQSKDTQIEDEAREISSMETSGSTEPQLNLLTMGEKVTSIRQLLRRTCLYMYRIINNDTSWTVQQNIFTMNRLPGAPGYNNSTMGTSTKISTGTGAVPFTYTYMTTVAWFMEAFLGTRGAVNWSINVASQNKPKGHLRAYRTNHYITTGYQQLFRATSATGVNQVSAYLWPGSPCGASGQALTNQVTNAGLNISVPNYTNNQFESTDRYKAWGYGGTESIPLYLPYDGGLNSNFSVEIIDGQKGKTVGNVAAYDVMSFYCGAGADFDLIFFLNAPPFWIYQSLPTAVT